jgi:hypothetical protein
MVRSDMVDPLCKNEGPLGIPRCNFVAAERAIVQSLSVLSAKIGPGGEQTPG